MRFYTYSNLDCNGEKSKHSLNSYALSGRKRWSRSTRSSMSAHLRNTVDDLTQEVPLSLSISALLFQKLANNIHFTTAFVIHQ